MPTNHLLALFLIFLSLISIRTYAYPVKNVSFSMVNNDLKKLLDEADTAAASLDYQEALKMYDEALILASDAELTEDKALIYKKIGIVYYKQKKYDLATKNYKSGIRIDGHSIVAADSYYNLALIQRKLNGRDSLAYFLEKSLAIYENQAASEKKFDTYRKAGILLKNTAFYEKALKYALYAYQGFGEIGNDKKMAMVSNTIAAVHRLQGNYEKAKAYYRFGLKIREALGDSLGLSNSYNSLANAHIATSNNDSAVFYYAKAIALKKKLGQRKELGRMLSNLASVYYLKADYQLAEGYYLKAMEENKLDQDSLSMLYTLNELAMTQLQLGNLTKSKLYLDSTQVLLSKQSNTDAVLRNLQVSAYYFEKAGYLKKSIVFHKKYLKEYRKVFDQKQADKIQELQERFESTQKQRRIESLSSVNDNNEAVIESQKAQIHQKNLLQLLTLTLLLLLLGVFMIFKQRQKIVRRNYEIEKYEAIFNEQESLKARIGKDLHDIIATNYDGIRLKISALKNAENPSLLIEKIMGEIKTINQDIRLISHRLSPLGNKLKDAPLTEIMVSQLSELQYYGKKYVYVELPLPESLNNMSLEDQTNFYGIFLEAIHNIGKHAGATKISIAHTLKEPLLEFLISDNGCGFSSEGSNGVGIKNMKKRAKLLKGQVRVDSSKDGTSVCIEFPINEIKK